MIVSVYRFVVESLVLAKPPWPLFRLHRQKIQFRVAMKAVGQKIHPVAAPGSDKAVIQAQVLEGLRREQVAQRRRVRTDTPWTKGEA